LGLSCFPLSLRGKLCNAAAMRASAKIRQAMRFHDDL
jgi:hypothetical protein